MSEATGTIRFHAEGYFLLRAPAFPISVYDDWLAAVEGITGAPDRRNCLSRWLGEKFTTSRTLLDALSFASPHAATAFLSEQRGKVRSQKESRRLEETLVKYFVRAHARATPFGLFAGTAVGTFGTSTAMALSAAEDHRRVARIDFSLLGSMIDWLSKRTDVRRASRYRVNSSLYSCAGRARYVERKGATRRDIDYELTGVELTPGLEVILSGSESLRSWPELEALLVPEYGDVGEIQQFLDDLIDAQVLVSELECSVTCDDPLSTLSQQLTTMGVASEVVCSLDRIVRTLRELEQPGSSLTGPLVQSIRREFADLGAPHFEDNTLYVQLQLAHEAPLVLHELVRKEIDQAVDCLVALSPGLPAKPYAAVEEEMLGFQLAFQRRYDDAMVPLAVALDPENGIGFLGSWSASAVDRRPPPRLTTEASTAWEGYLAERLLRLSPSGENELVLTSEDIEHRKRGQYDQPNDFMQVIAKLEADSTRAIDAGQFLVLVERCAGPTEAAISARFAIGNPELTDRLRSTVREIEHRDHRVLAEIVHLPGHRASNVVTRPRLTEYEIPYLSRSDVPDDRQIAIRDLYVFIESGRVVLWSKRLQKEILPRLSCAHTAMANAQLPIYRFLYALPLQQRVNAFQWNWGRLSANGWLPRVRFGRAILSLACWRISSATVRLLQATSRDQRGALINSLRDSRSIPRFVSVGTFGEDLILDLENELAWDVFIDELNANDGAVLTEVFPRPDSTALVSPDGHHTFEMVVPLRASSRPASPSKEREATRVTHSPGGEWLSLKIYTGPVTADRILREIIAPLVAELTGRGTVQRWFFVRYGDPDFHIRIRFQGCSTVLLSEVLPTLHARLAALIADGSVFQTVVDSYRPELARYGGPHGMDIAHTVFMLDSRCVLNVLTTFPDPGSAKDRLICAVAGVNGYLTAVSGSGAATVGALQTAVARRRASLWRGARDENAGKQQLSSEFRAIRRDVDDVLATPPRGPLAMAIGWIVERDAALRKEMARLEQGIRDRTISQDFSELLLSYAHMHVNRTLCDYAEDVELRVYDSLARHHESAIARARAQNTESVSTAGGGP